MLPIAINLIKSKVCSITEIFLIFIKTFPFSYKKEMKNSISSYKTTSVKLKDKDFIKNIIAGCSIKST